MIRNPVAKNLHKTCKPLVVSQKQRKLKSEATLQDARELLYESQFDSQSGAFVGVCWDELSEMDWDVCERVMNSVGCSSISIEDEEDEK